MGKKKNKKEMIFSATIYNSLPIRLRLQIPNVFFSVYDERVLLYMGNST